MNTTQQYKGFLHITLLAHVHVNPLKLDLLYTYCYQAEPPSLFVPLFHIQNFTFVSDEHLVHHFG